MKPITRKDWAQQAFYFWHTRIQGAKPPQYIYFLGSMARYGAAATFWFYRATFSTGQSFRLQDLVVKVVVFMKQIKG